MIEELINLEDTKTGDFFESSFLGEFFFCRFELCVSGAENFSPEINAKFAATIADLKGEKVIESLTKKELKCDSEFTFATEKQRYDVTLKFLKDCNDKKSDPDFDPNIEHDWSNALMFSKKHFERFYRNSEAAAEIQAIFTWLCGM